MRARVDELLDLADQAVDEAADLLLEEAQEAEERATAEQEAAEAAADAGGYDGDEPVDTDPLLDEATSRVGMARQRLPRAGGTKRAETRQRAEQVSSAIASLRAQHVETN
jgi:hypothetical protein